MVETFTMNDIFLVDLDFFRGERLIFFYKLKVFLWDQNYSQ